MPTDKERLNLIEKKLRFLEAILDSKKSGAAPKAVEPAQKDAVKPDKSGAFK